MRSDADIHERREAWSRYWAGGAAHSCVGSFDSAYSGVIGDFWKSIFVDATPRCRVLDLATGNGPLARLAYQGRQQVTGLEVDAVDLADVAPDWFDPETQPGMRFHSGVAVEHLPFPDGTFDCVVSQFGVEYARRPDAFLETLRVAQPRACFAFVMHHVDSVLSRVAREEAANADFLLSAHGLVAAARNVLPWIARAREGVEIAASAVAQSARDDYNRAMRDIGARIDVSSVPDVLMETRHWVHALLAARTSATLPEQQVRLAEHASQLRAAALRSAELVRFALDEAQVRAIAQVFQDARPNAVVHYEALRQHEGILGWGLRIDT